MNTWRRSSFGGEDQYKGFIRYRNSSILISVIVIIAVLLFVRSRMKQNIYVEPRQDAFYLKSYTGEESLVSYDELTAVSYAEDLDLGAAAGGTDDRKAKSGIWKNDQFGEYHLYALPNVTSYVILTAEEGTTVFNYESANTTKQIYDAFYDLMEKKGLADQIKFDPAPEKESEA